LSPSFSFRRILVVVPAQLGDVLLCTPLIRAARARWPEARIDVLGFAGTLAMLAGNPDVAERIEIDKSRGIGGQLRQALTLWRRYDLALVTRTTDRAHLYGWVAARVRSGVVLDHGPGHRWKRWALQHRVTPRAEVHQVLEKLALIAPWQPQPGVLSVVPPTPEPVPEALLQQLRPSFVVVHAPSMWRYKQWPVAHFRAVVQALLAEGVQVVLSGSGSANDQAIVAAVRDVGRAPELLDFSGRLSLAQWTGVLAHARAYLGPDTSVTHLAAALGVPIVSIYGPTPPEQFGPWPRAHAAVPPWQHRAQRQEVQRIVLLQGDDLPGRRCVPCGAMGCEGRHDSVSQCLTTITPERVLDELHALMDSRQSVEQITPGGSRAAA
jgi:heptosyltransferase-3